MKALIFLFDNNMKPINDFSKTIYLVGYIAIPFIIITKIPFVNGNSFEPKTLLSLFILIWVNDTFAFIVGKSLGKNKLFEKISPKKTIEGFIGGMFFSLIASVVLAKYFVTEPISKWLVIAIISSVFGTLGDLIESKFKRIAGVKDSGSIMPGHGGVLDRLDSIIFVAPIVFLFYQILYYVS
jgi:phosphatidate cytidylyltransferase